MEPEERAAWETMRVLREVRDTLRPGTKEYDQADKEFRKAEAE